MLSLLVLCATQDLPSLSWQPRLKENGTLFKFIYNKHKIHIFGFSIYWGDRDPYEMLIQKEVRVFLMYINITNITRSQIL